MGPPENFVDRWDHLVALQYLLSMKFLAVFFFHFSIFATNYTNLCDSQILACRTWHNTEMKGLICMTRLFIFWQMKFLSKSSSWRGKVLKSLGEREKPRHNLFFGIISILYQNQNYQSRCTTSLINFGPWGKTRVSRAHLNFDPLH